MRRIEYFELISSLFEFKTINDECKNEFVVLKSNHLNTVERISDKTAFESSENHVHVLNNITKDEYQSLQQVAQIFGNVLLNLLKYEYPKKHFRVYISVRLYDSMIIRFHQKWDGEEPYCYPEDFKLPNDKVYLFEN